MSLLEAYIDFDASSSEEFDEEEAYAWDASDLYFEPDWIFQVEEANANHQATLSQENAVGKTSTPFYLKLSVLTSSFCLMLSLVEMIHEGKECKVVWQKRGYFGWFYYPGIGSQKKRLFGRFSLIFGVVSSMIQSCINLVALVMNKNFVNVEILPVLLSSGYMVAALVDQGGKHMVKCEVHGKCVAECSRLKVDDSV